LGRNNKTKHLLRKIYQGRCFVNVVEESQIRNGVTFGQIEIFFLIEKEN